MIGGGFDSRSGPQGPDALRAWPYPYRAMLAICSDLDETPTREHYLETARFLNTNEETAIGRGVGLEVGNTIYFDMPSEQFAYWNTDDRGRAMVASLIRSGHIDCLHSFGDLATQRAHAGRALDELCARGCQLKVWIDHGTAVTNFGADIMRGSGDIRGSQAYHADLTVGFGVRYVWRGRVTSVVGQEVRRSLRGILTPGHVVASSRTLAKEWLKGVLARRRSTKYRPHLENEVLWSSRLRDGQPVVEFLRSNPSWGGVSHNDTGRRIGEVLTDRMLGHLVERRGAMVLYCHLGKGDTNGLLPTATHGAFQRLARWFQDGAILVTTTRRLLEYCEVRRSISVTQRDADGRVCLELRTVVPAPNPPVSRSALSGLTFYVGEPERTTLLFEGEPIPELLRNGPDETGRRSVSIPWSRLQFPFAGPREVV